MYPECISFSGGLPNSENLVFSSPAIRCGEVCMTTAGRAAPRSAAAKAGGKAAQKASGKSRTAPRAATKNAPAAQAKELHKPQADPPDYNIAAVERALDLLEALARIGPAPLANLAEAANCTRTAAFRLLRTLQGRGFAIQDEARGIWRLGARWGVLGRAAHDQGALAATATPFLAALGQAIGENVYLRTRDGLQAETVALYQADPTLRLYSTLGARGPLHAGASRLLLAYAPEAVQTQVLAQRLPRFTAATRTDPVWIAADLQRIRARGYLVTADEVHPGAVSATAPVRDASGQVVAALYVSAPSMRMRPPRPRSLLPQVLEAAARLSRALGAPVPEPSEMPKSRTESSTRQGGGTPVLLVRP
jgi:IclR family transcriptional regulator, KDG regulon repressor